MINKTKLALGITAATLTMTGALVSPQAVAGTKAQHHAEVASVTHKVEALEAQLQAMQSELSRLRAEAGRSSTNSAKVQELDQWMTSVKSEPKDSKKSKDNMVFFRGGFGHANNQRGGTLDPTNNATLTGLGLGGASRNGQLVGAINDKDSWYFGAGFDFSLNDNLFGMMDKTEVFAELLVDYRQLGERKANGLSRAALGGEALILPEAALGTGTGTATVIPAVNTQSATVNQLTVAASPKIKFFKGSAFRPWIIPVGFEINVISPPSDAITVLNPGMQFGAGADYKLWNNIYVGADARYHYSADDIDGVRTDGVTAGGYLGIGF